jgi:hypothetical protein
MKNMNYDEMLAQQFSGLVINLVKHDTSPTGYPCYIEAHIGKTPKDKGEYAKDLSNYIYRTTGLRYQYMPEYRGKGKTTTIRWFMSWENVAPIQENICKAFGKKMLAKDYLPFEFSSLIIQNKARGVIPKAA